MSRRALSRLQRFPRLVSGRFLPTSDHRRALFQVQQSQLQVEVTGFESLDPFVAQLLLRFEAPAHQPLAGAIHIGSISVQALVECPDDRSHHNS